MPSYQGLLNEKLPELIRKLRETWETYGTDYTYWVAADGTIVVPPLAHINTTNVLDPTPYTYVPYDIMIEVHSHPTYGAFFSSEYDRRHQEKMPGNILHVCIGNLYTSEPTVVVQPGRDVGGIGWNIV